MFCAAICDSPLHLHPLAAGAPCDRLCDFMRCGGYCTFSDRFTLYKALASGAAPGTNPSHLQQSCCCTDALESFGHVRGKIAGKAQALEKLCAMCDDLMAVVKLVYLVKREGGWRTTKDWGTVLSLGEQQRMGMARLFFHRCAAAAMLLRFELRVRTLRACALSNASLGPSDRDCFDTLCRVAFCVSIFSLSS